MGTRIDYVSVRCQQRGISGASITAALKYGKKERWFHGSFIYYLGKKAIATAVTREPAIRHRTHLLEGTAIVVDESTGQVLTAFKEKRGLKQIRRNYISLGRFKRNLFGAQ